MRYVEKGGTLVVTGKIPTRYDTGESCRFLGGISVGTTVIGAGKVIANGKHLGLVFDEDDSLEDIEAFGQLMKEAGIVPKVEMSCEPCLWVDTGVHDTEIILEPRMRGSAVLQESEGERVLFVFNHNPEPHTYTLRFNFPCERLICLTEAEDIDVTDGLCTVSPDRKSGQIYLVK
jgi:hypothetical protein